MENYVLFYSNYCDHSKKFLEALYKTELRDKFKKACVDDRKNIPKEITAVPTIIVPRINKLLVGEEAFHWLKGITQMLQNNSQNQPEPQQQNSNSLNNQDGDPTNASYSMGQVSAYSNTMGGYSDNFSFIDNQDPLEHNFSFLKSGSSGINTPQQLENDQDKVKKSQTDIAYERLMAQRNSEVKGGISRI